MDASFLIEKASINNLEDICLIYSNARKFMAENHNASQWGNVYPEIDLIKKDIEEEKLFIVKKDSEIVGVFCFFIGGDPTYKRIFGRWLSNKPYGVIHRISSNFSYKGLTSKVLDWCFEKVDSIRIDTHFNNKPMRKALKKCGFKYCGLIKCHNQTIRLAYQKDKY